MIEAILKDKKGSPTERQIRKPMVLRTTGIGTIEQEVYSFSVRNNGTENGNLLGEIIKPEETFNFDAGGLNNFYAKNSISYDATETEFVIIYNY